MPRSASLIGRQFERAVNELEGALFKELAARPLSGFELETLYKDRPIRAGWQLETTIGDNLVPINLLLPVDFPFAAPLFAFATAPPKLTYPHVEDDGVLCLLSNSSSVATQRPTDVVIELLGEARELIGKGIAGTNREDFRKEFVSYWNRSGTDSIRFLSLLEPTGQSRLVTAWLASTQYIFGEDSASLSTWLSRRYGNKKYELSPAGLIWLPTPMLPSQYPRTSVGVWKLVSDVGDAAGKKVLHSLTSEAPKEIPILLASHSAHGVCYAGVTLQKPHKADSRFLKNGSPLSRGFRPGRIPASILTERYLNSLEPVKRHKVDRADHKWIHGRDYDLGLFELATKKVVVLGCGSVGGPVAKTLATSGIGKITIIDPENLTWANIGRHVLGANHVGVSKSKFLAEELQEKFPHLEFEWRLTGWEEVAEAEPEILTDADLIVSTIGNWSSEGLLNEWQRSNGAPPIIYGWTEPFASAGHAVVMTGTGACFQCQLDEFGGASLTVTKWDLGSTLKQEPACGVMFQPYGPIDLTYSANLVTELAVDVLLKRVTTPIEKIWASRESLVTGNGGSWSEQWLELTNGNRHGGFSIEREWEINGDCVVCGIRKRHANV